MKKTICWGLFILSMALYIDNFYFRLLLQLTSIVSANIALFLMIFLVHSFFYPKNTTDHAQVISYPPMIMLFSINLSVSFFILGFYIDFIERIILFNTDFLDLINSSLAILSSWGSFEIGRVPLIGFVSTRLSLIDKNRSGEKLKILTNGKFIYAEKGEWY